MNRPSSRSEIPRTWGTEIRLIVPGDIIFQKMMKS
jgi:hypothetical protein